MKRNRGDGSEISFSGSRELTYGLLREIEYGDRGQIGDRLYIG